MEIANVSHINEFNMELALYQLSILTIKKRYVACAQSISRGTLCNMCAFYELRIETILDSIQDILLSSYKNVCVYNI